MMLLKVTSALLREHRFEVMVVSLRAGGVLRSRFESMGVPVKSLQT